LVALVKSAVHLFIFENGKLLMSQRKNTGYMDGYFSLVAGHLEGNEMVIDAAIREAHEEIGIIITPEDVVVSQIMHRNSDSERIDFFVQINAWEGQICNNEIEKCEQLVWVDLDSLPKHSIPYILRAIKNNANNKFFDSFGWK
jgi:8-oxo-dGTP diphosphatase